MKKLLLSVAFAMAVCFGVKAQDEPAVTENPAEVKDSKVLTADELKAQRAELVAFFKSEDYQKALAKADAKVPKETGIGGVDALSTALSHMLTTLKENRTLLPQMYASVTGQTLDGLPASEIKPISPDQFVVFSKLCIQMGTDLIKSSKDLITLPGEIKSAGIMKGIKALKTVGYIKSSISALKQELAFNSKMINNLVATNKLAMAANTAK